MKQASWIAAATLATMSVAQAQPQGEACENASVDRLKASYLTCDRLMSNHRAAPELAQRCAAIGEQLKQRGFSGDFDRLIAWWQRERGAAQQPDTTSSLPPCEDSASTVYSKDDV